MARAPKHRKSDKAPNLTSSTSALRDGSASRARLQRVLDIIEEARRAPVLDGRPLKVIRDELWDGACGEPKSD